MIIYFLISVIVLRVGWYYIVLSGSCYGSMEIIGLEAGFASARVLLWLYMEFLKFRFVFVSTESILSSLDRLLFNRIILLYSFLVSGRITYRRIYFVVVGSGYSSLNFFFKVQIGFSSVRVSGWHKMEL